MTPKTALKSGWGLWLWQIGWYILAASATMLISLGSIAQMSANGVFTGWAAQMGAPGAENYLTAILTVLIPAYVLKMLYEWIETAVSEQFGAVRQVELTKDDLRFMVGALEEYQLMEEREKDNAAYTEQGRAHAGQQARRAGRMIGHLIHYM